MNDFCEKHKISIVDTNKRYATYTALRPQYFNSSTDYNSVNTEIVNSFEPLYTITIPLSELERMKEFEYNIQWPDNLDENVIIININTNFKIIKGTSSGLTLCTACSGSYYLTGTTCAEICTDGTYKNTLTNNNLCSTVNI